MTCIEASDVLDSHAGTTCLTIGKPGKLQWSRSLSSRAMLFTATEVPIANGVCWAVVAGFVNSNTYTYIVLPLVT